MRKLTILFTISIFSFFASNEVHGQFLFGPNSSLEAAAKAGRADGLYIRGINYLAQCNPDEAFKCFHQAYKDGNIRAATALGNMFEVGAGMHGNYITTLKIEEIKLQFSVSIGLIEMVFMNPRKLIERGYIGPLELIPIILEGLSSILM